MAKDQSKDDRLYARFDIHLDEHPKIAALSDAAFRAFIESTLYSRRQLSDGFLDVRVVKKRWSAKVVRELSGNDSVTPSWTPVEGGYQIHDFEKHQTTRADIDAKRDAGRLGGLAKAAKKLAPASDVLQQKASTNLAKTETETETETETVATDVATTHTWENASPTTVLAFESVWKAWPKQQRKQEALHAFASAVRKLGLGEASVQVQRFGDAYRATTDEQYVPTLGKWLREERWTDALPQLRADREWLTPAEKNIRKIRAEEELIAQGGQTEYQEFMSRTMSEANRQREIRS